MRIILASFFLLAAWKWSKWRNWQEYYPTIVFMMALSLLEIIITDNHKLWLLVKTPSPSSPVMNTLFVTATVFPATVLLYLSNLPDKPVRQVCYILMWISLYSLIETLLGHFGMVSYRNGWSLQWSILFNCAMFPILRVHYSNPLLAWFLSGIVLIFIWMVFDFSLELIK